MSKALNFDLVVQQDSISVGKLEGDACAGVYLSSVYLDRLIEVHGPALIRTASIEKTGQMPDAVLNLLGIMTRLLTTYATAVQTERDAHNNVQMKEAWDAIMQAKDQLDNIKR